MKSQDTQYLALLQDRDAQERYSHLSIILADTYELTRQVITYRQHFSNPAVAGTANPLILQDLQNKTHALEQDLQTRTEQSTRLSSQNISLSNNLQDTKEMLFQAETSLHELNSKYIASSKQAAKGEVNAVRVKELEAQL